MSELDTNTPGGVTGWSIIEVDDLPRTVANPHTPASDAPPSNVPESNAPESNVVGQTANLIGRQAVLVVMALAANVIAARVLAPEGRGALAFALQAAYMVSFVILLGTEKAVAVVMPGAPTTRGVPAIWAASWWRGALVAGAGGAALVAVSSANPTADAWYYLAPVAMMGIASAISRSLETSAVNAHRSQLALINTAAASGLTLLFVIGLALIDNTDPRVWLVGYGVAALIVGVALCWRHGQLRHATLRSSSTDIKPSLLSRTGYRLFPASLASYAAYRSDRLILPVLAGTEALGLYVVVVALTDIIAAPVEALSNVLLPRWRAAVIAGTFDPGKTLAIAVSYLTVACTGAVFIGGAILVPVFGAAYEPAKDLLPTLAFGSALFSLGRLAATWRLAQGFVNLASGADLAGMVTAVTAYFVLIPPLGAQGAAVGSIIGYGTTIVALLIGPKWATISTDLEEADQR